MNKVMEKLEALRQHAVTTYENLLQEDVECIGHLDNIQVDVYQIAKSPFTFGGYAPNLADVSKCVDLVACFEYVDKALFINKVRLNTRNIPNKKEAYRIFKKLREVCDFLPGPTTYVVDNNVCEPESIVEFFEREE